VLIIILRRIILKKLNKFLKVGIGFLLLFPCLSYAIADIDIYNTGSAIV